MADERDLAPIGRDGQPIRALAFAGGGFNTIIQLGVDISGMHTLSRLADGIELALGIVGREIRAVDA